MFVWLVWFVCLFVCLVGLGLKMPEDVCLVGLVCLFGLVCFVLR